LNKNSYKPLIGVVITVAIGALIAFAGSQGSSDINGLPLYAIAILLTFLIQWIMFLPSYLYKTEKYFDLTGSITYITIISLVVAINQEIDLRSIILMTLVILWAVRLGTFLFTRIKSAGEDRRFREIKKSFSRFFLTWTLQGLWVSFSLAAALAAITSDNHIELGILAIIGIALWIIGFSIEAISDEQKRRFKSNPNNDGKFIKNGLWSWSRHPNYFGEIVLWTGIAIVSFPVLTGWQYFTLISPVFITLLLTKISGIPMLEKRADEKWGGQKEYEEYKNNTSILIPLPPKRSS